MLNAYQNMATFIYYTFLLNDMSFSKFSHLCQLGITERTLLSVMDDSDDDFISHNIDVANMIVTNQTDSSPPVYERKST